MSNELKGKKIVFLVANTSVEQVELTSPLQAVTDAGGKRHDEQSVVCPMQGYTLVTSRRPDDLDAFSKAAVEAFAGDDVND